VTPAIPAEASEPASTVAAAGACPSAPAVFSRARRHSATARAAAAAAPPCSAVRQVCRAYFICFSGLLFFLGLQGPPWAPGRPWRGHGTPPNGGSGAEVASVAAAARDTRVMTRQGGTVVAAWLPQELSATGGAARYQAGRAIAA